MWLRSILIIVIFSCTLCSSQEDFSPVVVTVFEAFDPVSTGVMSPEDVRVLFDIMEYSFEEQILEEWIRDADENGSGYLEFPEFVSFVSRVREVDTYFVESLQDVAAFITES